MHFWARVAAETAMAAGAQGKFFEFDRTVFARQREINGLLQQKAQAMGKDPAQIRDTDVQIAVFADLAGEIGLDAAQVRQDLEAGTYRDRVNREAQQAAALGVSGTPGWFINGRYFAGAYPYEAFKAEVDRELAWARAGNRPPFPKGTNVAQVQRRAQQPAGPDPNKVYDLQAGNAPFAGQAAAKVTILHYLDYQ